MDINNAKTARAYVAAWSESSPERRRTMFESTAKDQRFCAWLCIGRGMERTRKAHLAAARVLDTAAEKAKREAAKAA